MSEADRERGVCLVIGAGDELVSQRSACRVLTLLSSLKKE